MPNRRHLRLPAPLLAAAARAADPLPVATWLHWLMAHPPAQAAILAYPDPAESQPCNARLPLSAGAELSALFTSAELRRLMATGADYHPQSPWPRKE